MGALQGGMWRLAGKGQGGSRVPQQVVSLPLPSCQEEQGRWWRGTEGHATAHKRERPQQRLLPGPLRGTEGLGGRSPPLTLVLTGPGLTRPPATSRTTPTARYPPPTYRPAHSGHLIMSICLSSSAGSKQGVGQGRLSPISQYWMASGRHTRGEEMACDDHLLSGEYGAGTNYL